jgi:hypothetical protein
MSDDKKEQLPREFFGISESEEKELLRVMEHIQVDYRFTSMSEPEFFSKLFADVSNKEKLKILYLSRTFWKWGFDSAKKDP